MTKRYLVVNVAIPDDVSITEARGYIRAELAAAGGCRHPDDPLFRGLEVLSISSAKKQEPRK